MDHMWMARAHALAKAAPAKLGAGKTQQARMSARLGAGEVGKAEAKQGLATEPDVTYQSMSLDDAIQKLFDLERAYEGKLASLQARLTSLEMGGSQAGMGALQAKIASLEAKVMENSDNIIQLDKNQRQSMQNNKQNDMHSFRVCPINT
jgi:hypothetical protein